jgi:PleD family two-component response regulator
VELADQALYLAKQAGRGRVILHGDAAGEAPR